MTNQSYGLYFSQRAAASGARIRTVIGGPDYKHFDYMPDYSGREECLNDDPDAIYVGSVDANGQFTPASWKP